MCFVDMKKAFDRVPRKVMEWAMRKKSLSEFMVRAVMSRDGHFRKSVRKSANCGLKFLFADLRT